MKKTASFKDKILLLKKNKILLIFPALSILSILIYYTFLLTILVIAIILHNKVLLIVFLSLALAGYVMIYFLSNLFYVGFIAALYKIVHGGKPSILECILLAKSKAKTIFIWSFLERYWFLNYFYLFRRIFGTHKNFLSVSENLSAGIISSMVLPIIIIDNVDIKVAIKRSEEISRVDWVKNLSSRTYSVWVFILGLD